MLYEKEYRDILITESVKDILMYHSKDIPLQFKLDCRAWRQVVVVIFSHIALLFTGQIYTIQWEIKKKNS